MLDSKNFFMPAEWNRHERTLMEWPVQSSMVWPCNFVPFCEGIAALVNAVLEFEKVALVVNEDTAAQARVLCGSGVEYLVVPHNDAWLRDNGPTFLLDKDKRLSAVNWRFNAWGEKYPEFEQDNLVAPAILDHYGVPYFNSPLVMEGGSVHADGEGTLLTTRECLLNKNRNPSLGEAEIEAELKTRLGVSKIIWLNKGLHGDETDGHVDNAACFAKTGTIIMQTCSDPEDPNFGITNENLEILKNAADARGGKMEIVKIPQPPARFYKDVRLTLSYLNFYFVNGGIILPVFGADAERTDRQAESILKNLFPERKIVAIDGMAYITEGGNVHCLTQQMPEGVY